MSLDVKILFFAKAREIVGKSEAEIRLPESLSYNQLLSKIVEQFLLKDIQHVLKIALNEELPSEEAILQFKKEDRIAVIPPLSGG